MSELDDLITAELRKTLAEAPATVGEIWYSGRLAGLREAAEIVKPIGQRPCDCEPWRCYCDKTEDAASVAAWDHAEGLRVALLALAEGGEHAREASP